MTNYTFPTRLGVNSITLRMASQNAISQSPFTFKQQVLQYPGRRWEADITLPRMRHDDARVWIAWLAKLDGALNTFTMGDPKGYVPQGHAGGTPLVAGAGQTGSSLDVDGCDPDRGWWLRAGDYIQLGSGADARLYMVTEDVDSDASGAATLSLWPAIPTAPADNTPVVVTNAVGAFRLATNVSTWSIDEASFYGIQFSAVSVV